MTVHMFWAYGGISQLESVAMNSFIRMGYGLTVWTYDLSIQLPNGVQKRDAREILDEKCVFVNKVGSYASFSDMFRYAVLSTIGGLYVDTDVIAVKPASELPPGKFLVSERKSIDGRMVTGLKMITGLNKFIRHKVALNNNVIYNPCPDPNDMISLAFRRAYEFPKDKITWSEIGPMLLNDLVQEMPSHGYEIKQVEFANPYPYWNCPEMLLQPGGMVPEQTYFIHCYSEMWRWKRVRKDSLYPVNCVLQRFGSFA